MVSTGLRLVIGSWKIIATSLPRTSRIAGSGSVKRSRPASLMLPSMRPFSCGMSRMTDSAVTLLPEPDSPTIATVSLAATSKDTLRTTGIHCPSRMNEVVRPEIDSTGELVAPGFAPAASWSDAFGPILIQKLGFSSRVDDQQDQARFRRGGGGR